MDIGWKIVSAGAGIVSGIIANKVVDVVWKGIPGIYRNLGGGRPHRSPHAEPSPAGVRPADSGPLR